MLCLLAALLISVQMIFAVPAGEYYDDEGRLRVMILRDGTIYSIDRNGHTTSTMKVVREDSDGRFYIRLVVDGQPVGYENSNNAWWSEDGNIYLNLANQPKTLVRK